MKAIYFRVFFVLFSQTLSFAQLKVEAEVRPRFEFRHGFGSLFPDNVDPSAFVSQRTRLNTSFKKEYLNFHLSVQDIRVWGDVPQLNRGDRNGFGVFQAWGELIFSPDISLKLGRQALDLDDQRIFGSVAWAQQARSHDMALFKYKRNKTILQVGAAFNQDGETNTGNLLTTENTYKSIQFAWFHRDWEALSASFLFLNNGLQFIDETNSENNATRFSQTLGTRVIYKMAKVAFFSNAYYQFGNDVNDNSISAYLLSLETNFVARQGLTLILGGEFISGNDNGTPSNGENKAFSPFYGTNHKFNGLMDYFFVGNHADNVGLMDLYAGAQLAVCEKASLYSRIHSFSSAADIQNIDKTHLGVEADFVLNYNFKKDINIQVGYSHLL